MQRKHAPVARRGYLIKRAAPRTPPHIQLDRNSDGRGIGNVCLYTAIHHLFPQDRCYIRSQGTGTMVQVKNFNKVYGETVAVSDLSFQVGAGQILGLVGPNGAGKTTTLRAIAGIIPPTQGQLSIAGYDVVSKPVEAKQQFAYIPD